MGSISVFPLSVSCLHVHTPNQLPHPHLSHNPSWSPLLAKQPKFRSKIVVHRGNSRDPKESLFMDENGAIDDMDGYLNYLSLEYDSVWDTKPSWCQPWTIVLTGGLVTACSWLILRSIVFTSLVFLLVSIWWYIFLYAYPKEYINMIADRRKRVVNGVEDTFGAEKDQ